MDNETKFSSQELEQKACELLGAQEQGKGDVKEFMEKHLNESQQKMVHQIMENPEKLKALLNSPFAKRMMEKLSKKNEE